MGAVQPVDVAATVSAIGGVVAVVVGARVTRRSPEVDQHGTLVLPVDPADRPAALRERIAALEAQMKDALEDIEDLRERTVMLEALRTSLETMERQQRTAPRPRRTTR